MLDGLTYRVKTEPYQEHVTKGKETPTEGSQCDSTLHAIDQANSKGNKFLAATGIGGVSCARHCFNQPCAFGDLERGER